MRLAPATRYMTPRTCVAASCQSQRCKRRFANATFMYPRAVCSSALAKSYGIYASYAAMVTASVRHRVCESETNLNVDLSNVRMCKTQMNTNRCQLAPQKLKSLVEDWHSARKRVACNRVAIASNAAQKLRYGWLLVGRKMLQLLFTVTALFHTHTSARK
eukprot:6471922-Amphidinium_carterae.1